MEFIHKESIAIFSNPGVCSRQLLSPENSSSKRVTITEVHLEPGAVQPRHMHDVSEQIWYALQGSGTLLLQNSEQPFSAGDVVRFAACDIHGFKNNSDLPFVYLSITTPPIDFSYAYRNKT